MENKLNYLTETEKCAIEQFAKLMRDELGQSLIKMEIFGSKIRGDYSDSSDIDILIIVKERTLDIMDRVADITSRLNIEHNLSLSPVIFSEYEYKINIDMTSPFSLAVEVEGVRL
jgi:predicted nucleotidyltransferase